MPIVGTAPPLRRGEPLRVLCWNIQFAAGRARRFWYDGGPDVRVPVAEVRATLAAMRPVVERADLALLQEVDRDAARTGRLDELLALGDGFPVRASAPYHRAAYVPHPLPRPLGRVDMHLALLSRVALRAGERIDLPRMNESRLRRAFNLKRAILWAEVPVEEGPAMAVAVTHLSAFTGGDDTLARQVAVVRAWMEAREAEGRPWLVAGDFNLMPPGDDPARVGEPRDDALAALVPRFRSVVAGLTYQRWGRGPDRQLDYVFVGGGIDVLDVCVEATGLSDHLPVWVDVRVA